MKQNRRKFIYNSIAVLTTMGVGTKIFGNTPFLIEKSYDSQPWIELSKSSYLHNVSQISRMAEGKPIVAVLKNNAYGLGDIQVAKILNNSPHIASLAVVRDNRAISMRKEGITKPILLMGDFDRHNADSLINGEIILSIFSKDSLKKIKLIAKQFKKPIKVALYIDTGLGRMGIPFEQVHTIAQEVSMNDLLMITHTFSTLTTPKDFAKQQILLFETTIKKLEEKGILPGLVHLAPSYSLLDLPNSHMDAVRPGILLHGSFPMAKAEKAKEFPLKVSYRLKAPVIRLEKLKEGDTIGFSRFYKVEKDEWIATLPIGWADGYDSRAENGAKVLLGNKLYKVVNVNSSHANISLGTETTIKIGDVATLIGPEKPEITPAGFSKLIEGNNYLQINYKESLPKRIYETF